MAPGCGLGGRRLPRQLSLSRVSSRFVVRPVSMRIAAHTLLEDRFFHVEKLPMRDAVDFHVQPVFPTVIGGLLLYYRNQ